MSLTEKCDIYAAVHDAGINRVVKHLMQQRPSLFNFGTSFLASNPDLLCEKITAVPEVNRQQNPLLTTLEPLPVIGLPLGQSSSNNLAINFAIQLSKAEIDFHQGNIFPLPPELDPLASQRLAVHFKVCAGLDCLNDFPVLNRRPPNVRPSTSKLECFCLDLYAIGGSKISGMPSSQRIEIKTDGIDIVDLKPQGLENAIECYAKSVLNHGIFPHVAEIVSNLTFGIIDIPPSSGNLQVSGNLRLSGATTVTNNPDIENDQLKTFINLDELNLNVVFSPGGGSGGSGGSGDGTITRTTKSRSRTGTFDLTVAISETTFKKIYNALLEGFKFTASRPGSGSGIFSVGYTVSAHLDNGIVDLRDNGSILISELDVKWDTLQLNVGIDIPTQTIGGFCLVPNPFGGCLIRAPSIDIFEAKPDISLPINLGGLITSEITLGAIPKIFYGVGSGVPNRWQLTLVPTLPIDLDIIDIADSVGDLFHNLIVNAIVSLLSSLGLPDWAISFIDSVLGGIEGIIRNILDIGDDLGEFAMSLISDADIFQDLIDRLAQFIALTILELKDPLEVLEGNSAIPLIPVKLPIEFLDVRVNNNGNELILEGDIGN
ncbi:hypothetical protein [Candidatus Nitrosocosmicus hydrocola]|uniref:hypothetical protein n=1 Tax=Candidatus Nitrosocosmicus hydrocola TaxID=1826872 RepID=UPI0011E5B562|nr:hypothetical protein [Candidatus Nitrosocosmicus hydrocola]